MQLMQEAIASTHLLCESIATYLPESLAENLAQRDPSH